MKKVINSNDHRWTGTGAYDIAKRIEAGIPLNRKQTKAHKQRGADLEKPKVVTTVGRVRSLEENTQAIPRIGEMFPRAGDTLCIPVNKACQEKPACGMDVMGISDEEIASVAAAQSRKKRGQ